MQLLLSPAGVSTAPGEDPTSEGQPSYAAGGVPPLRLLILSGLPLGSLGSEKLSPATPGARFASCGIISTVKALRRVLLALGLAGLLAGILRLRGTGGTPPQRGGWRELSGPDLR